MGSLEAAVPGFGRGQQRELKGVSGDESCMAEAQTPTLKDPRNSWRLECRRQ